MIVYAVADDALSPDFPIGDSLEVFFRREDTKRFIEEVRGDEQELAAKLRIEEGELEAGGFELAARTPKHDDAKRYQRHADDLMQVNAVAAVEGDVEEDDVPAVRVEPDDCGAGEDRNNRQDSGWHTRRLRSRYGRKARMRAVTGIWVFAVIFFVLVIALFIFMTRR